MPNADYVVRSTNLATGKSQIIRRPDGGRWTKEAAEQMSKRLATEEGIGSSKRFEPRLQFTVEEAQIDSSGGYCCESLRRGGSCSCEPYSGVPE